MEGGKDAPCPRDVTPDPSFKPGVEFHRELQESIWILLGGVCKSLWILLYSVCVKHLTVYESLNRLLWIHLQEFLQEWTQGLSPKFQPCKLSPHEGKISF